MLQASFVLIGCEFAGMCACAVYVLMHICAGHLHSSVFMY